VPRWSFETTLVRPEGVGTWTFAPIPFDVESETGVKARLRVKGAIDGVPFKGTLLPTGSGGHFVVVNKDLRIKIGKSAGDKVSVAMEVDKSPVVVRVPKDLQSALNSRQKTLREFENMAPSHRKAYVRWIEDAKGKETRASRISKALAMIAKEKKL
jgi:hypothetical protein